LFFCDQSRKQEDGKEAAHPGVVSAVDQSKHVMINQQSFGLGVDTENTLARLGSSTEIGASSTTVQAMNNSSATVLPEQTTLDTDFGAPNTADAIEASGDSGIGKAKGKVSLLSTAISKPKGYPLSLSYWQKRKLHRLSAQELKKKNLAWVPKVNILVKNRDDVQAFNAKRVTDMKEKKKEARKQLPSQRFMPNHQSYWLWHHPCSLPMYMWNSSPNMYGYLSVPYFNPWCGSLYYGGLSNYFAYR
jgi:hypothetical protein